MAKTRPLDDENVAAVTSIPKFEAPDCLLHALIGAAQMSVTVRVDVPGAGRVWLNGRNGLFWSDIQDPQTFFVTPSCDASVRADSVSRGRLQARPLDELLWSAGYVGSGGALLSRCHLYDVIELNHWPNFTRIPHSENLFPLCSLLSYRPTSLSFAYRMLRISADEAFRFYSAATVSGHVRVVCSQPPRSDVPPSSAISGDEGGSQVANAFWSRLFKRISGL